MPFVHFAAFEDSAMSSTTPVPSPRSSGAAAEDGGASSSAPPPSSSDPPTEFSRIQLDISNSVLPLSRLTPTPSSRDGLTEEAELQLRSLGCDLIQLAGKLLKLPQVSVPSRRGAL